MNRKVVFTTLLWGTSAGGLLALVTGDRQAVSLRLWLAGFAIWFALATLRTLLDRVPLGPATTRPAFTLRSAPADTRTKRLSQVRANEGLLLRARDNERAHTQQLRPRLITLTDHYLPLVHGFDRRLQPDRANQLLGELAWMITEGAPGRTPSLAEVDEFVTRVTTVSASIPADILASAEEIV